MDNESTSNRLVGALRVLFTFGPHSRQLERKFLRWGLAWIVCMFSTQYLLRNGLVEGALAWTLPAVTVAVSLVTFYRYYQLLRGTDELMRKIQVDGICFAFGAAIMLTLGLTTFEPLGAPQLTGKNIVQIMVFAWLFGQVVGSWHHQ